MLADLVAVAANSIDVVAQRASVKFARFARLEDAPNVFVLMRHADKTVRDNVRSWLFRSRKWPEGK